MARFTLEKPFAPMYLGRAIRKHGISSFEIETLCTATTLEELNKLEIFYIAHYSSSDPQMGYNETEGGEEENKRV